MYTLISVNITSAETKSNHIPSKQVVFVTKGRLSGNYNSNTRLGYVHKPEIRLMIFILFPKINVYTHNIIIGASTIIKSIDSPHA